jgi:hypothetical protein
LKKKLKAIQRFRFVDLCFQTMESDTISGKMIKPGFFQKQNAVHPEPDEFIVNRKGILKMGEKKFDQKRILKKVFFHIPQKSKGWSTYKPLEPYHPFVQKWRMFMLVPLGFEVWAFPYRLALGVPSVSSQMQLTPIDFLMDMLFLADMVVNLFTKIPKAPGRENAIATFQGVARHYFRNTFPFQILLPFPYWVTTFILTNHLQDPTVCGRETLSGVAMTWSCVLNTLDWQVYIWWATTFLRFLPRMMRLIHDFTVLESNMVHLLYLFSRFVLEQ